MHETTYTSGHQLAVALAQHLVRNCHLLQHSPKAMCGNMCGLPQHGVSGPQHSGAAGAVIVAALNSPKVKKRRRSPFFRLRCMRQTYVFCLRARRRKKFGPLFCLRRSRRKNIGALLCLRRRRILFFWAIPGMICRCIIVLHISMALRTFSSCLDTVVVNYKRTYQVHITSCQVGTFLMTLRLKLHIYHVM